jgi:hypothetical protein
MINLWIQQNPLLERSVMFSDITNLPEDTGIDIDKVAWFSVSGDCKFAVRRFYPQWIPERGRTAFLTGDLARSALYTIFEYYRQPENRHDKDY